MPQPCNWFRLLFGLPVKVDSARALTESLLWFELVCVLVKKPLSEFAVFRERFRDVFFSSNVPLSASIRQIGLRSFPNTLAVPNAAWDLSLDPKHEQ